MGENSAQKLEKLAKTKKEYEPPLATLKKAIAHLNENKPIRSLSLTPEERSHITAYPFLTDKKVVYAANVDESALPSMENEFVAKVRAYAEKEGNSVITICAKLEEELSQLSPEEGQEFLKSLGVDDTGLKRLIQAAFKTLGLITYITTGEIETRAWPIRTGTNAQEAAGKIHTDIQKGFIRAEVVSFQDMIAYKGRVGAREAGKARSEGKEYTVHDGDVILFFHS